MQLKVPMRFHLETPGEVSRAWRARFPERPHGRAECRSVHEDYDAAEAGRRSLYEPALNLVADLHALG